MVISFNRKQSISWSPWPMTRWITSDRALWSPLLWSWSNSRRSPVQR